ncbi:MAG TPA: polysaccharide biosynthesis/export family protein [Caulobacteraceae bacterium]|nr:polysaccharide biosynthesis/export family protein [Caulobacteraceae bacterium]
MRRLIPLILVLGAAGCGSLPHDGPSARDVEARAAPAGPYGLIDLDYRTSQIVAAAPAPAFRGLSDVTTSAQIDRIGEGDVLSVSIYTPSAGPSKPDDDEEAKDQVQNIPRLTVDRTGEIPVPFAGEVRVIGLTPREAAAAIEARLRGRLINPQVIVGMVANVANSVTVIGEVRNAGRFPLSANNDSLLDALASAGGPTRPPADAVVTLVRGARSANISLASLLADPAQNVRLAPRDQIRVAYKPRKFSTFGALAKASQVAIEDEHLSLAAALSRMGGLDTNAADAQAVMVFRMERPEVAKALGITAEPTEQGVPVVYRLNLKDPTGMFVANAFEIRNDDLVYVPRADAAEVRKFFELVSAISRVGYDIRVTSVVR